MKEKLIGHCYGTSNDLSWGVFDKSQILVIKHVFVMNFLCNPLCLFVCFIYNLA